MKTVVIAIGLVTFLVIEVIVSYRGLDLRKWSNWLYGAVIFLTFTVMGFALTSNLTESLKAGGLMAFLTLIGGLAMRRHKQRYGGMAESLLSQYGKEDDPSLFAKLVRRLLGKYKQS